ncbi:MAG: NAD(P)-binding protein [Rhodopseudomonas sp.]|nr:NAD(P)-binding protein [Rhodopseudomonas sp.]
MSVEERVFIAGAGPVGMVAAANLVRYGIPVTVFEAGAKLSGESRASTFHPSTLDMLDDLGFAKPLIETGLVAPRFQYRTRQDGIIGAFDFAAIADATRHPYRLQNEQFKLTRIILDKLKDNPNFKIEFGKEVAGVEQDSDSVTVSFANGAAAETRSGRWLIGADGASSAIRHGLNIEFEGFTWPERFLVVSTPFDFYSVIPGLDSVSYVADPEQWYFLLQIPGMWRVMFPIAADMSDEAAMAPDYAQASLRRVVPEVANFEVLHTTLYRVHQRVAKTYRNGRAFLAGDAAHINNPLGGMGMNGGIHDAINLTERLAMVVKGGAPDEELDRYDRQRRQVTVEYVQSQTIKNKQNLEARTEEDRVRFRDEMQRASEDPVLARQYLMRVSMFASLKRAAELG